MLFFAYFRVSKKRNIKRSPNGMKPSENLFSERKQYRRLGVHVRRSTRKPRGRGARLPPWARPPPSWAPCCSTDVLLPPIYYLRTPKHPGSRRNTISTTVTFCIREIPSWGLFRSSAGEGIYHGGLLHHPSPSDEV